MTIGIGYQCSDGVVLCSDRQVTSTTGFKQAQRKIWSSQAVDKWSFIFSYSGLTDAATVMFRRVTEGLKEKFEFAKGTFPYQRARAVLDEVYFDHASEGLETLIGFYSDHQSAHLFKTNGTHVVDGLAEYIGVGDSSALKYISSFLRPRLHTIEEAKALATYLVSVANRYVDGCSGGPDIYTLNDNGVIVETNLGIQSQHETHFLQYEEQIGNELRRLLLEPDK
jgi:hypothetical protein